jgi:hypothetical protein
MKKIWICVIIAFFILSVESLHAQKFEQIVEKSLFSMENPNDSVLKTGIYFLRRNFEFDFSLWDSKNFTVEYTQVEEDINLKKKVLFFNRTKKAKYIYSTFNIKGANFYYTWLSKFARKGKILGRKEEEFLINPVPIATKENIMRIYDCKSYNADSTIVYPGLVIKFNNRTDSLTQVVLKTLGNHKYLGLVVDNKLVAFSFRHWFIEENTFFLTLIFYDTSAEEMEYYRNILFKQTLIKL